MSVTTISEDEARRYAEDVVRSELGMFLRLGDSEYDEAGNEYQFDLVIRSPKTIRDSPSGEVADVRFFSELDLGQVTVDGKSGDVERPDIPTIKAKIRDQQEQVEIAVRKALVSAAGHRFAHLPFPENQYAPLEDILAHVLLHGSLSMDDISMMDADRENRRYHEYVQNLLELDLLTKDGNTLTSGDVLIGIEDECDSYQETMNTAIGRYFEHNLGEFDMINRTLGPYLVIAARYYRRSLELEEPPLIDEEELRQSIISEYSGKEQRQKLMKFYRYLIHLENVGILRSVNQAGQRLWVGDDEVDEMLREQTEYLGPVQTLLA
jgi:hypothetical protein